MRRIVLTALAGGVLGVLGTAAPAAADDTVVVPGVSFPEGDTRLTSFGCADLYHASTASPLVRVGNLGESPAGLRSAGVLMAGRDTATGPVHRVDSVASTTVAGFAARTIDGATGAAWVWYAAPGLQAGQVWAGRADLSAGPGWTYVDAAAATYTWTLLDAATGHAVEQAGSAPLAAFTDEHGDGPGFLLAGLGCDGAPFSLDALQLGGPGGVTTFDLEGLALRTFVAASAAEVAPGAPVTLTGSTVDAAGEVTGTPLVLEARPEGAADFRPVGGPVVADGDGVVASEVRPERTTEYRWFAPTTGYADATWSAPVTVVVGGPR